MVIAGDDHARHCARDKGRAYWSAALPIVLEKHGYLDFEVRDPSVLEDRDALTGRAGVLVGALPEAAWTSRMLGVLDESPCPVLLESPLPEPVLRLLGVTRCTPLEPSGHLVLSPDAGERVVARGGRLGAPVAERRISTVRADPSMHWSCLAGDLITPEMADAWRETSWDAFGWSATDPLVEAMWVTAGGERSPALVRRGNIWAASFGLFAFLGQAHTAEPWEPGEARATGDPGTVELLMLEVIDAMHAVAGVPRARVLPWPEGYDWALNVRHDFDRGLAPEAVAETLARHDRAGTSATWYWRARHLQHPDAPLRHARRNTVVHTANDHPEPEIGDWPTRMRTDEAPANQAVRLVARHPRHEVALHTEMVWIGAGHERRLVEAVAGVPVHGSCAHGNPWCFRFQGAPSVLWAARQGLSYTENFQVLHRHPYRFAGLRADGSVGPIDVLCLPKHASLDQQITTPDTRSNEVLAAAPDWRAAGGLLQVMNHPDINQDALFDLLHRLPAERRWNVTAETAARWWAATHVSDRVRLRVAGDGTPSIDGVDVDDRVQIEVLLPDRSRRVSRADARPG